MQPIIFHLDMNSYFASVEQQDNPSFRGRPLGVCEHLGGIIIGASREAKKWGINTGTPVWEAKKLYPKVILTHTHPDRYRFYTRKFLRVVSEYTDKVEKYSIDEVFLDMTRFCNIKIGSSVQRRASSAEKWQLVNPWEEAVRIAREIKKRFVTEVGDFLTCSIGIADNKLLAKIASDMKKPDGLVVIVPIVVQGRALLSGEQAKGLHYGNNTLVLSKSDLYDRLKLTDIPGIARRMERQLNSIGIFNLKQLRDYPKSKLIAKFGIMGSHLHNMGQLRGSFKEKNYADDKIKSIGHMYTLPQEFRKPEFFMPVLYKLCEMVGRRLRRQELMGNVIHFYYHDKNYDGFGKSAKLGYFLQDGREIFLECVRIFDSAFNQRTNQRQISGVKLIGITVAGLQPFVNQLSLFGDVERARRIVAALDKINDKYGEFTLMRAEQIKSGKVFRDSVGFGRMKELDVWED